jgi:hypothetical protein
MYTFIKLTVPPPSMIIFDASNRDQCEVKRSKTNTPLQALIMMNDPTVLEASRVLSQKLLEEKKDETYNLTKAFRLIICRKPDDKEMAILKSYYDEELQLFNQNKLSADTTLQQGEYMHDDKLDKSSTAALMKTIEMIYNMDEAITK